MATGGRKVVKRAKAPRRAKPTRKPQSARPRPRKPKSVQRRADKPKSEIGRLKSLLRAAEDRQTATAEILKVIASSPSDVQPVFEAIVKSAAKLFAPCSATITTLKDDKLHWGATAASISGFDVERVRSVYPIPFDRNRAPSARAMLERRIIEIPDVAAPDTPEFTRNAAAAGGFRSITFVPLVDREQGIGTIIFTNPKAGFRYSERQLALIQTFADQAVIAIHNARLFNEKQQALERQTATADILKVIARSPDTLQPVLDAIVKTSNDLCASDASTIFLFRDGKFYLRAVAGQLPPQLEYMKANPQLIHQPGSVIARVACQKRTIHVPNVADDPELNQGFTGLGGPRALLVSPLMQDGEVLGVIALRQSFLKPFTRRQIEAVEVFADQAVIAISNVNLFEQVQQRTRELSKSLDDLRTAQDRLVQTEKLASLGQLTAGIAHEIKNPLNFVNNFSALSVELTDELNNLLAHSELAGDIRKEIGEVTALLKDNLSKIVQHGKRADSIVKNMLLHSREGSGERRSADINALVGESLNLAYHGARAEKAGFSVALKHDLDPDAGALDVYPQEITRALLNLISNGFYAATKRKVEAGDGSFEPLVSAATRNLGKTVEIRIRDNGTGIAPEVREKMFNPFFTTKPTGEGTGLGLSMTHDIIVKQHGGRINVETEPGVFTEFIITLPRDQTAFGEKP
jgi:signal transduction histidine kinase